MIVTHDNFHTYEDHSNFVVNKKLQEIEDQKVTLFINYAANDMYNQWLSLPDGIVVPKQLGTYTLHHEASAKYKNQNIAVLVQLKYDELKNNYDSSLCKR